MYGNFVRKCASALIAVTAFALVASSAGAQDKTDVTVGVAGSSSQIALMAFNVARTKNFIADQGVNLNVIDFGAGSKGIQAFASGDVDFVIATFEHVLRLRSKGIGAKSVASMSKAPGIVLAVTKDFAKDYKDINDLVGKNIGVSAPGSASHTFLNLFLRGKGVNPDQVGVVGVGNAAGAVAAIRTGNEIQALVNYDPVITMLVQSGDLKPVVDLRNIETTKQILGDFTFLSLITSDDYIQKNPQAVQGVVTGVVKALRWMQTATPEEIRAAIPEDFWKENPDIYLESIKENVSGLALDGKVTQAEAEGVYKNLLVDDPSVDGSKLDYPASFDNSFAEKANAK